MLPRLCVLTGLAWSLLRWASFSSLLRKELALEEGLALHSVRLGKFLELSESWFL